MSIKTSTNSDKVIIIPQNDHAFQFWEVAGKLLHALGLHITDAPSVALALKDFIDRVTSMMTITDTI